MSRGLERNKSNYTKEVRRVIAPIVGISDGEYEVRRLSTIPDPVWQKKAQRYGVAQRELPPFPPNFLPSLFSGDSMRELSRARALANEHVTVAEMNTTVFGFNDRSTGLFIPWDAGLEIDLEYETQRYKIFGPCVVSFDHEVARAEYSSLVIPGTFELMADAHLAELLNSDFDAVVINTPKMPKKSVTRGIFSATYGYLNRIVQVGGEDRELHILKGIRDDGSNYSTEQHELLVANDSALKAMQIIVSTWVDNLAREADIWPKEHHEASARISKEILGIVNERITSRFVN